MLKVHVRTAAIVALASVLLVGRANAEEDVNALLKAYDGSDADGRLILETAVSGNENGMGWMNAALTARDPPAPLYCLPKDEVLTGLQIISMLRIAADDPQIGHLPFGLAIMLVLIKNMPCGAK